MNFVVTDALYDFVVIGGALMGVAAALFMAVSALQRRKQGREKKTGTVRSGRRRS